MAKKLCFLACFMFLAVPVVNGLQFPGTISLNTPEGAKDQFSSVAFPHNKHSDLNCATCHHTFKDSMATGDEMVTSCAGSEDCHANYDSRTDANSYYMAYHSKDSDRSCRGCHAMMRDKGEKTGPYGCRACHPKKTK